MPPAIITPLKCTGYAGLGTNATSSLFKKAKEICAIPSLDPIEAILLYQDQDQH